MEILMMNVFAVMSKKTVDTSPSMYISFSYRKTSVCGDAFLFYDD